MKEKPWPYTDGEIRTMYKDAVDPRGQIKIIAELCCKSTKEVEARLLALGCDLSISSKKHPNYIKTSNNANAWTEQELDILIRGADRGDTVESIQRRLPTRSVKAIYREAKKCGFPIKAQTRRRDTN